MKNSDRIAYLTDYPKLKKLTDHWAKLHQVTNDSWPAVFRTNEHKRRVLRRDRLALRLIDKIKKEFNTTNFHWIQTGGRGWAIVWKPDES